MWNTIINIIEWFGDQYKRVTLIKRFNNSAKQAFASGKAPTLLLARTTRGEERYRHNFSKFGQGGFNIKALSGEPLPNNQLVEVARVLLDNKIFVRQMVTLGWDTLEIYDSTTKKGIRYKLIDFADIGGFIDG